MTHSVHQASRKAKRKRQSPLPSRLERNLSAYAFAAGSAGVAMLACVLPSEAKIVATQTDISIPPFGAPVQLDINNDGQFDFALTYINFDRQAPGGARNVAPPLGSFFDVGLQVSPLQAGNETIQIASHYGRRLCAAPVPHDVTIGAGRPFAAGPLVLAGLSGTSEGVPFCDWSVSRSPFLGVRFKDTAGETHYGWIRVQIGQGESRVIKGYGYETVPNKPIAAGATSGPVGQAWLDPLPRTTPEPASLGLLAEGATGLAGWRREEETPAL